MALTANDILNQGSAFNIANPINAGSLAVASSTPPYTPLVGSAQVTESDKTSLTPLTGVLPQTEMNQAFAPTLPSNEQFTYQPLQNTPETTLGQAPQLAPTTTPTAQAKAAQAATPQPTSAAQYGAAQAQAARGTVDPNSLIQNQFTDLMNTQKDQYGIPLWARTAVTAAQQEATRAGLGNSTQALGATTAAILNAALPMAAANAQVVAQLNSQNLSNSQQTMLSNASWMNAALQFNASSRQQNDQFFSNLTANMAQFNTAQTNAISQFNAGQTNQMDQFLTNLNSQRQEFNTQNQLLVNQSNVQWQRAINTANTAGTNAANQANVQNLFNMSQNSLNNLWQQARDEASWSLTSSENSQNRALSLVNSALNRQTSLDLLNSQMQASMFSSLGNFAVNAIGGAVGTGGSGATGIGQGIASLFSSSSGTPDLNPVGNI